MNKYIIIFRIIPLFIIISGLFSGCNEREKKDLNSSTEKLLIKINPEEAIEYNLDSIFSVKKYIRLEISEKCLFSDVKSVALFDNKIFVFVNIIRSENAIFCFDTTGKFLFQVSRKGGGPQEYELLKDVSFDSKNKLIAVLVKGRVLFFNTNGHYLKTMKITEFYDEVEIQGIDTVFLARDGCYVSNSCSSISLFIKGRKTNEFLPSYPILKHGSPLNYERLKKNSQGIYYLREFCDTVIYKYINKSFSPYIRVDFGNHSFLGNKDWSDKIFEVDNKDPYTSMPVFMIKNNAWGNSLITDFVNYFESKNLIWGRYRYQRELYDFIYNKTDRRINNIRKYNTKNILEFGNGPYGSFFENEIINVLDMEVFWSEKMELDDKIFASMPLSEEVKDAKIDDNPILILIRINGKCK